MELPPTTLRVPEHTPAELNERLWRETERRIWYYAWHTDKIGERLVELDNEWDMERALEANASTIGLLGLTLTALGGRRFLPVPVAVMGFLLQHALQGWCPPVRLFRRLGLRTQTEIEAERYALKALRGDFRGLGETASAGAEGQPAQKAVEAIKD